MQPLAVVGLLAGAALVGVAIYEFSQPATSPTSGTAGQAVTFTSSAQSVSVTRGTTGTTLTFIYPSGYDVSLDNSSGWTLSGQTATSSTYTIAASAPTGTVNATCTPASSGTTTTTGTATTYGAIAVTVS